MTCEFKRPDPQDLYNSIAARFSVNVLGGSAIIPESVESYVVANDYAMAEEFYAIAEQQWKERDPRYACCENLYKIAADRGVFPKPAGFAQAYVRVAGTPNSSIPNPLTFRFGNNQYRAINSSFNTIPASGSFVIQVKAIEPGPAGNVISGVGSLVNAIPEITSVEAYGNVACGGTEAETCEEFRTRYLSKMSYQPRATDAWIKEKILEWPCTTRVIAREGSCNTCNNCNNCGCNDCQGALEFYVMFDNTFECGIAPQSVIDEINLWLFGTPTGTGNGQVEIGVCGKLYTATPYAVDVIVNGLDCTTPSIINEIEESVKEIFKRMSPSKTVSRRIVEYAVAQIVGSDESFSVDFIIPDGGADFTACGDLESLCDYMPCVGKIIFESSVNGVCEC